MGFVWGVATSAYQIEGAATEDGRGPSIWDTFSHTLAENGDVACDHYHRYAEDLDLMARLGVDAYRFSLAWPRIQPSGGGEVNRAGLDFYRRLLDGLAERGITPYVTLYHWDLPQALEDLGGWRSRDTALRFAEYAAIAAEAFGGYGVRWITLNEPYCSSITGYAEGRHAPGAREGHGALAAAHHLLLAHGLAVGVLRAGDPDGVVGLTLNMSPAVPATDSDADRAAARRRDLLVNRQFTEPVLSGQYPADAELVWGHLTDFSFRRDGDLSVISAPLDFLGVNYYFPEHVAGADNGPGATAFDIGVRAAQPSTVETTGLGWPVEPQGLHDVLAGLRSQFASLPPIYITENGCAYPDVVSGDVVDDPARIAFMASHLDALDRARADGVDVRGYFYWSLIDNFEWARGYDPRFGLVYVDYATQARIPKESFAWYADRIRRSR